MAIPIRFMTANAKFAIIIWTSLAFAVKHLDRSTRIPSKTIEVLYGTKISAATVKALKTFAGPTTKAPRDQFSPPLSVAATRRLPGGCRLIRPYLIERDASHGKTSSRKSATDSRMRLAPYTVLQRMSCQANSRPGTSKHFAPCFTARSNFSKRQKAVPSP